METLATKDEEYHQYKDKIKEICAICGCQFENNWEHYKMKGNICQDCNLRCQRVSSNKLTEFEADLILVKKRARLEGEEVSPQVMEKITRDCIAYYKEEVKMFKKYLKEKLAANERLKVRIKLMQK